MKDNFFKKVRESEKEYHTKLYKSKVLFTPGTWLAKPVNFLIDPFEMVEKSDNIRGFQEIILQLLLLK